MRDSLHALVSSPVKIICELLKYVITGEGAFCAPFVTTSIFVHSRLLDKDSNLVNPSPKDIDGNDPQNVPNIEMMPIAYNTSDDIIAGKGVFSLLPTLVKPKSSGSVRLASNDPRAKPAVDFGYLTNPDDYGVLRAAIRLALRISMEINKSYPLKNLRVPARDCDEDIDSFIRTYLRTSYHYTSTCRMAPLANGGVVDAQLKVHGIEGLRVCDTSIFPEIIAAHTMAPVVMVAEKCAHMMTATR